MQDGEDFLDLHALGLNATEDDRLIMRFFDEQENWTSVRLPMADGIGVARKVAEYVMKRRMQQALDQAPEQPGPALPAAETALLLAKSLEVIRWSKGGAVLRASTDLGIPVQLALSRDLYESLRRKLIAEQPMRPKNQRKRSGK